MENQYRKTFSDLMVNKKLVYVHGFMSSGATHTAKILQEYMPQCTIIAPDLPIHPEEAMELLRKIQTDERPDIVIGTSMGGMYTEMLYGTDRICVNPAFQMGSTISESNMLGKQIYQSPRKDGVQEVIVTKALQKEYKEITERCFASVTPEEQERVYGHRLIEKAIFHYIMPVIRWIDDKQEGRERKIVFIDWETLRDSYGKPKSSLHKAYEFLLDHYNVYFTAPAPTNNPTALTEMQTWIKDVFSAPAWNRILFVNQPQFLLGDYLISTQNNEDFMGTVLPFGSDEFKTWEEVITFFERLGGQ